MSLGEYLPNSNTKLLLHLNGSSADSSGNNNNGTDTAITYSQANGKFGQGAGFNGSSSYINIPYNVNLSPTSAITVSAWVNITTFVNYSKIICRAYRGDATWNAPYFSYSLSLTTTGSMSIDFGVTVSGSASSAETGALSTNTWYNLIGTFDGSNIKIYLNGKLIAQTARSGSIDYNANASTTIGSRSNLANGEYFTGKIDETFIENTAWSAEKVKKYYTSSKGRFGII